MGVLQKVILTCKGISKSAGTISDKTGKNPIMVMADMVGCLVKYAASPQNYELFEFYRLTSSQRSTYVTYGLSRKMIKKFNKQSDIDIFENKLKFAEVFSDMFCRDYISVADMTFEDFERFVHGKSKLICKPYEGSQGAGIKVFRVENVRELYSEIKGKYLNGFMLEEWIEQHPVLNEIYPDAVNCLRIVTVYDGEETHLVTGGVTFGTETEIANGSQPSIVAPVDFTTGILNKPAATFGSQLYKTHPKTNARIEGVQLPFWKETVDMLREACRRVPTVGYIGWDIAITPNGPVIIEGNTTPGYKYYQIPCHLDNGTGNRDRYERLLRRK